MTELVEAQPKHWTYRRLVICARAAALRMVADGGLIMAGHLSFVSLLALFPFIIFLTALAGFLGQTEAGTYFVAFLFERMPEEIAGVLQVPLLEVLQETRGGLLTIGILLSVWTASSGLEAARVSLNRAYFAGQRRSVWRTRLESMALVILASICVIASMLALVFGPVIWAELETYVALPDRLRISWVVVRYLLCTVLIWLAVSTLYFVLPAARLKPRWVFPGTFIVVLLWLVAATAFSFYVRNFGAFTVTYGSLAGVILTMLFFYILSVIFIFGAEFNAAFARAEGGLPPPRRRKDDPPPPPRRRRWRDKGAT